MKNKIVVIAFDDGPHQKEDLAKFKALDSKVFGKNVPLVGVVCRGLQILNVCTSKIKVDGTNSTQKILEIIKKNPFKTEIRLILVDSPTLAGFNPVNPYEIFNKTGIPVILIPESKPKERIVKVYSKIFPERKKQIEYLKKLPKLESLTVKINSNPSISKKIYFHTIGTTKNEVKNLLNYLSEFSAIPEPLRIAHLIASKQEISK